MIQSKIKTPKAITPFDSESKENLKDMTLEIDIKREVKIVGDEVGRRRLIK